MANLAILQALQQSYPNIYTEAERDEFVKTCRQNIMALRKKHKKVLISHDMFDDFSELYQTMLPENKYTPASINAFLELYQQWEMNIARTGLSQESALLGFYSDLKGIADTLKKLSCEVTRSVFGSEVVFIPCELANEIEDVLVGSATPKILKTLGVGASHPVRQLGRLFLKFSACSSNPLRQGNEYVNIALGNALFGSAITTPSCMAHVGDTYFQVSLECDGLTLRSYLAVCDLKLRLKDKVAQLLKNHSLKVVLNNGLRVSTQIDNIEAHVRGRCKKAFKKHEDWLKTIVKASVLYINCEWMSVDELNLACDLLNITAHDLGEHYQNIVGDGISVNVEHLFDGVCALKHLSDLLGGSEKVLTFLKHKNSFERFNSRMLSRMVLKSLISHPTDDTSRDIYVTSIREDRELGFACFDSEASVGPIIIQDESTVKPKLRCKLKSTMLMLPVMDMTLDTTLYERFKKLSPDQFIADFLTYCQEFRAQHMQFIALSKVNNENFAEMHLPLQLNFRFVQRLLRYYQDLHALCQSNHVLPTHNEIIETLNPGVAEYYRRFWEAGDSLYLLERDVYFDNCNEERWFTAEMKPLLAAELFDATEHEHLTPREVAMNLLESNSSTKLSVFLDSSLADEKPLKWSQRVLRRFSPRRSTSTSSTSTDERAPSPTKHTGTLSSSPRSPKPVQSQTGLSRSAERMITFFWGASEHKPSEFARQRSKSSLAITTQASSSYEIASRRRQSLPDPDIIFDSIEAGTTDMASAESSDDALSPVKDV